MSARASRRQRGCVVAISTAGTTSGPARVDVWWRTNPPELLDVPYDGGKAQVTETGSEVAIQMFSAHADLPDGVSCPVVGHPRLIGVRLDAERRRAKR